MGVTVQQTALFWGAGVIVATSAILWWRYKRCKIPTSWRKVGEISELAIFPLKSGRGTEVDELEVTDLGVRTTGNSPKELQNLRDRFFVAYNSSKDHFITCRNYPPLMMVQTSSAGEAAVQFSAPGVPNITIKLPNPASKPEKKRITLWRNEVFEITDCGEEVAKWISDYLKEPNIRIGYHLQGYKRRNVDYPPWDKFKKYYKTMRSFDTGVFTDYATINMMCQSSVDDLNTRLPSHLKALPPKQFRPNFVVKGTQPYEEDAWDWVKIGDSLVMRVVRPCTRCIMTTMDPETGIKEPNSEPLRTLRTYRLMTDPEGRKLEGDAPKLGLYFGVHKLGLVRKGDPVYVAQ